MEAGFRVRATFSLVVTPLYDVCKQQMRRVAGTPVAQFAFDVPGKELTFTSCFYKSTVIHRL